MLQPIDLDPAAVVRQFDRRAARFEQSDFLLREVETRMFSRLDVVKLQPAAILDLGCGLGAGVMALGRRYPKAAIEGIDVSERMIGRARKSVTAPSDGVFSRFLKSLGAGQPPLLTFRQADLEHLPAANDSTDLLWSNLALHWLARPEVALAEMYRVARPGSLLMFSAFGVDTLRELRPYRQAMAAAVDVMPFRDMHDWGDALVETGFAEPVMDMERIQLTYADPERLLADVRLLGGNALRARRKGLSARSLKADLVRALERQQDEAGQLTLTFEIAYGHAWVPERKKRSDGLATIEFLPRK